MRKYLCMAAFAVAVFSCQQEELVEAQQEGQSVEPVRLVQVVNGSQLMEVGVLATRSVEAGDYLLQFDSEATYQSFLDRLKGMSHKERMELVERYGLVSLQEMAAMADRELEQIGAEAANEAEFKAAYERYKAKYEGVLVDNKYDETDLC